MAGDRVYALSWRETGLLRIRDDLRTFLEAEVRVLPPWRRAGEDVTAWMGWGRKASGRRAVERARRDGCAHLLLEDGFIRSQGLGVTGARALSIVADGSGIYYDATGPSDLESMLEAGGFSAGELSRARQLIALIRREGLSKYNTGLPVPPGFFKDGEERVLIADQTANDASLLYGLTGERTFPDMLQAALDENPGAKIYIKTHPDVLAGKRKGAMPQVRHERIVWLTENWHPHDLLKHFSRVYVATSLMGLDALLLGRQVHCFGMPFYAGWGLTQDRQSCPRRTAARSLEELVAAAFLRYSRYLDPQTGQSSDALAIARFIARQKRHFRRWADIHGKPWSGRVFAFGFQRWKRPQVRPFFGEGADVRFVRDARAARRAGITGADRLAVWGQRAPRGLETLEQETGLKRVCVEDGFLRSTGLGADFTPPMSLVFDTRGIYYDPSRESDLENILNETDFSPALLREAASLRAFIAENRLTKYNLPLEPLRLNGKTGGKDVILVPGQVETDASIRLGCAGIRTNLALLEAVRRDNPDAFIIYKPHPDVAAGNRRGRVHLREALKYCDHVERRASIIACLEKADAVHVMTSLAGFDALLRGLDVTCHGGPFYAGWGLTRDFARQTRRHRRLSLDELTAGALVLYPRYYDPQVKGFVSAGFTARRLAGQMAVRRAGGDGLARRLMRKVFRYVYWSLKR